MPKQGDLPTESVIGAKDERLLVVVSLSCAVVVERANIRAARGAASIVISWSAEEEGGSPAHLAAAGDIHGRGRPRLHLQHRACLCDGCVCL